ncbi:hypothetical protein BS78_04G212100 [Paspalum vaginatum]|nr:hypothetical protein BS78_04G212100 [Paspalum vaginatum]
MSEAEEREDPMLLEAALCLWRAAPDAAPSPRNTEKQVEALLAAGGLEEMDGPTVTPCPDAGDREHDRALGEARSTAIAVVPEAAGRDEAVDKTPATSVEASSPARDTDIQTRPPALLPAPVLSLPAAQAPANSFSLPLRSKRLAAQKLARVPVAKRGEVLVMMRLGYAEDAASVTASGTKRYNGIYHGGLTASHIQAMSELVPMVGPRCRGAAVVA